jgi:hypothetical protein
MDNAVDREAKGRGVYYRGQDSNRVKLSNIDVRQIKRLLAEGQHTQREIGNMFGVTGYAICDIKRGRTWRHITLLYRRKVVL